MLWLGVLCKASAHWPSVWTVLSWRWRLMISSTSTSQTSTRWTSFSSWTWNRWRTCCSRTRWPSEPKTRWQPTGRHDGWILNCCLIRWLTCSCVIVQIYDAAVRWLKYDVLNRQQYIVDILGKVRFPLVSKNFLSKTVQAEPLIQDNPECLKMVICESLTPDH